MTDDELKARILARRAAFVAAAITSLGGAACRTTVPPTEPTQSVTIAPPPASDAAAPTASAKPVTRDAGTPAPIDTGNDIPPTACLSIRRN